MSERNVADYVVEQLDAWGVRNIYGVPGDALLPLLEAIGKHPRLRFISVKHEGAAALMASAEAKLTDQLGVCAGTSGPGAANLINGLADAKSDRTPVLALTGQVDSYNLGTDYKQYIDQSILMAAVTQYSGLVAVPDSCNDILIKAMREAIINGSVSHVTFTKDVWKLKIAEALRPFEPYLKTAAQSRPEVLAEAIKRINEASRPAILVGRGIRGLGSELMKLAEKWQAGLCLTMPAKGMLPGEHPLVMGGLGEGGSEASTAMLQEADLILLVGATWWPKEYMPSFTRIIQLDTVPGNIGRQMPVEFGVIGDLSDLIPQIVGGIMVKEKISWVERLRDLRNQWLRKINPEMVATGSPVAPGYLVKAMEQVVADDAIITLDVGDHTVWFNRIFNGTRQDVLISGTWRTMGFGLPAAISAKLAQPERQVVALVGDGCLAQTMGEFLTAVRYQLPITVVVVNNGYLAMEKGRMEVKQMDPAVTAVTNPDFARFAQICGGVGFRVEWAEDLAETLSQAILSNQPAIVDVLTAPVIFPVTLEKSRQKQEPVLV